MSICQHDAVDQLLFNWVLYTFLPNISFVFVFIISSKRTQALYLFNATFLSFWARVWLSQSVWSDPKGYGLLDLCNTKLNTSNVNSSPPGQNGHHFADDTFGCIFVNEKFCILISISLKFVPKDSIDKNLNTGLDNGVTPNWRQAIIWTNADLIHWRIYEALGGMT